MRLLLLKLVGFWWLVLTALGAGASWALSAAGVPHQALSGLWRMGLVVWVLAWFTLTDELRKRARPAVKPGPAPASPDPKPEGYA